MSYSRVQNAGGDIEYLPRPPEVGSLTAEGRNWGLGEINGVIWRGKCERVGVKKMNFFVFLINIFSATNASYTEKVIERASQKGL